MLTFVGLNPVIVKVNFTTGLGANVETENGAGLVTKFIAAMNQIPTFYFTGREELDIAVLNALTATPVMIVYCIISVVMVVNVQQEVKFFVAAKALLPWLSCESLSIYLI